jgi:regulator of sigma E protease
MYQTSQLGFLYFLYLLAVISINLAVFNSLPIPALDGGKFLFLVIEGLRKKPINPAFEKKITALSFLFLLILVLLITIKDVKKIFF